MDALAPKHTTNAVKANQPQPKKVGNINQKAAQEIIEKIQNRMQEVKQRFKTQQLSESTMMDENKNLQQDAMLTDETDVLKITYFPHSSESEVDSDLVFDISIEEIEEGVCDILTFKEEEEHDSDEEPF